MITASDKKWIVPAIGAMLVWGFWAFLPKIALNTLQPHSIIFYESLGNFCVSVPILFYLRFRLQFQVKIVALVGMSSALTALAILAYFVALHNGPVAVVVTMTAMYPVLCLVLARVFLKEKLNRTQFAAIAMSVVALLLLVWPA